MGSTSRGFFKTCGLYSKQSAKCPTLCVALSAILSVHAQLTMQVVSHEMLCRQDVNRDVIGFICQLAIAQVVYTIIVSLLVS